ncbi:hypothetical protein [Methanococcoides sp. FTZ1]|uniref:hypothetical protein n=1 Tax=Methanococcoides sp. FTZ1 TaxID=3439061 RepID=UPI003F866F88
MVLPERCPLDNELQCKGKECHLFHVDWRTGEENCTIGYRSTHKQSNMSERVMDTYAEETRMRLGNKPTPFTYQDPERRVERDNRQPDIRNESENSRQQPAIQREEPVIRKPEIHEEIVMETEHTTVIHSHEATAEEKETEVIVETTERDSAAKSKLDRIMKLDDLPEDYEKEFWN